MGWDRQYRRAAGMVALVVAVFGGGVLLLELFGALPIAPRGATTPVIAPSVAAGLLLAALALAARLRASRGAARLGDAAAVGAGVVVALGLFSPRAGVARPAYLTVAAFELLAGALLWLDRTARGRHVSHWLALPVGAIALAASTGYVFHAPALYSPLERDAGMALGTALALLALAAGMLGARPTRGFTAVLAGDGAGSRVLRQLLPLALAIPLVGAALSALARLEPTTLPLIAATVAVCGAAGGVWVLFAIARVLNRDAANQRRLAGLVHECADAIVDTAADGTVLSWNRGAERSYGYRADEILGRDFAAVVPVEARDALARARAEVLAMRAGRVFEGPRVRKDGSSFVASTTLSPILGPDGAVVGISAVSRDVTRAREAEQALAHAFAVERRFRRALEAGNAAARAVSASLADLPRAGIRGVFRELVEQARAITDSSIAAIGFGTDPEQPLCLWVEAHAGHATGFDRPSPRLAHLAADRPELVGAATTPVMFRGEQLGVLLLVPRVGDASGEEATALMAQLLADRAGAAIEVARAYEREAYERAWLEAVLDQMVEPIVLLDANGKVRRRNRAALRLSAPDPLRIDEFGNPVMYDLRRPSGEPMPFAERPLPRVLRTRASIRGEEIVARTAAGVDVPLRVNAAPVYDGGDRLIGAVFAAQDITALKRIDRLRAEWTALVAHDLRQPVTAIRLSAESLRRACRDERAAAPIERIRRASDRLHRMIGDLLQDAQLQAERMTLERRTQDLNALVGSAVADLADEASGHHVVLELPATPQMVHVDAERIGQVLGNLLGNAAKYSTEGSDIAVAVRRVGAEAVVSVTNRGRGIPAGELPLVFERFRRSEATRRMGVPGLGLGLSIARGLVHAHGGRMWVESTVNETTTFSFALPLADRPYPAAAGAQRGGPGGAIIS